MTFLFEVSVNEMRMLSTEEKTFDILKFNRVVNIGDAIVYQLEQKELDADEDPGDIIPAEHHSKIVSIFEDTQGALKKGFVAVGFKIEP
jgi:hypothetical protein